MGVIERPGQAFRIAFFIEHGKNAVAESVLLEGEEDFAFDPHGLRGCGREDHKEPVAALEGLADLIVPAISSAEVMTAVPDADIVVAEEGGDFINEGFIGSGVGEEKLAGLSAAGHGLLRSGGEVIGDFAEGGGPMAGGGADQVLFFENPGDLPGGAQNDRDETVLEAAFGKCEIDFALDGSGSDGIGGKEDDHGVGVGEGVSHSVSPIFAGLEFFVVDKDGEAAGFEQASEFLGGGSVLVSVAKEDVFHGSPGYFSDWWSPGPRGWWKWLGEARELRIFWI